MSHRNGLYLRTREIPFTVIVEPWAEEYQISPGETCRVVAIHPSAQPTFEIELDGQVLIISVLDSGATYEFWSNGILEFFTPVPIP